MAKRGSGDPDGDHAEKYSGDEKSAKQFSTSSERTKSQAGCHVLFRAADHWRAVCARKVCSSSGRGGWKRVRHWSLYAPGPKNPRTSRIPRQPPTPRRAWSDGWRGAWAEPPSRGAGAEGGSGPRLARVAPADRPNSGILRGLRKEPGTFSKRSPFSRQVRSRPGLLLSGNVTFASRSARRAGDHRPDLHPDFAIEGGIPRRNKDPRWETPSSFDQSSG